MEYNFRKLVMIALFFLSLIFFIRKLEFEKYDSFNHSKCFSVMSS